MRSSWSMGPSRGANEHERERETLVGYERGLKGLSRQFYSEHPASFYAGWFLGDKHRKELSRGQVKSLLHAPRHD